MAPHRRALGAAHGRLAGARWCPKAAQRGLCVPRSCPLSCPPSCPPSCLRSRSWLGCPAGRPLALRRPLRWPQVGRGGAPLGTECSWSLAGTPYGTVGPPNCWSDDSRGSAPAVSGPPPRAKQPLRATPPPAPLPGSGLPCWLPVRTRPCPSPSRLSPDADWHQRHGRCWTEAPDLGHLERSKMCSLSTYPGWQISDRRGACDRP